MNLLKMPDENCFLYSVAMLLDEEPSSLSKELEIDYNAHHWIKVFPNQQEPYCYRGYHSQEITLLCLKRGIALVTLEVDPVISPDGEQLYHIYQNDMGHQTIKDIIKDRKALLYSDHHVVAWNGNDVYDPVGYIYPLERFKMTGAMVAFLM